LAGQSAALAAEGEVDGKGEQLPGVAETSRIPNRSKRGKCLALCVTMASAPPSDSL